MKIKNITKKDAKELILKNRFNIFNVIFTKKDGTKRSMNARLEVKSKLKDGKLRYNPEDFNYIIAYDMIKNNYRTINVNTLERLRMSKVDYSIKI